MVIPFLLRAPGILLVHTLFSWSLMLLLRAAGFLLDVLTLMTLALLNSLLGIFQSL